MSNQDILNQSQLAQAFSVNRTTVRAWTKRGLPFVQGDQGKENQYYHGITLWWMLGDEFAREDELLLSPVQKIIYARYKATGIHRADGVLDGDEDMADDAAMIDMLSVIGVPAADVVRDVGFIRGLATGLQQKRKPRSRHGK